MSKTYVLRIPSGQKLTINRDQVVEINHKLYNFVLPDSIKDMFWKYHDEISSELHKKGHEATLQDYETSLAHFRQWILEDTGRILLNRD
ncbi:MAG: hypothetical protein WC477_07425 [Patescibacteria group bacterium]